MMNQWVIQGLGALALVFLVTSLQINKRKSILWLQFVATSLFSVHFFLLNAVTGGAMNVIAAIRAVIFAERDRYSWLKKKYVMLSFIAIFWIVGFFTWDKMYSILPTIGMTFECYSLWEKDTKLLRRFLLAARPFWIVYDIIVGSWVGLATEAFFVSSILIAMFRFDFKKKKGKPKHPGF